MFYLGLMIPKFKNFFSNVPNWLVLTILPFATLFLLGVRYLTSEYVGGVYESLVSFFIIGLASFGEKVSALNFLDARILKFFGKISYSLYLIHFSVLYVFARFMFVKLPFLPYQNQYLIIHISLFLLSTLFATLLALFVFRYIETPSHALSKKIGHQINQE
jgi:peptidoglycan/LPS O-acetylase OafA/YrhL